MVWKEIELQQSIFIGMNIGLKIKGVENFMVRPEGTKSAKVIQVIETKANRGLGTEKDPVREVTQYWDLDGNFLAEFDTEHCLTIIEHDAKVIEKSILQAP